MTADDKRTILCNRGLIVEILTVWKRTFRFPIAYLGTISQNVIS